MWFRLDPTAASGLVTILPIMMFFRIAMILQAYDRILLRRAFTLIEMIVVMVIIAAMVTVILPYAAKSNDAMKVEHDCLSLAEAFRYAADLAADAGLAARVVIDSQNHSFMIETANPTDEQTFVPIEYLGGTAHLG